MCKKAHLLTAVNGAYAECGAQATIDTVRAQLATIQASAPDQRIADIAVLLEKYSAHVRFAGVTGGTTVQCPLALE